MKKKLTPETIRKIRQEKGISQSKLAEALGYSTPYIQKIENYRTPLTKNFEYNFITWLVQNYDLDCLEEGKPAFYEWLMPIVFFTILIACAIIKKMGE